MPPSWDAGAATHKALRRDRHARLAARAAVGVLVAGGLAGGLAAVLSSNHPAHSPSAGPASSTRPTVSAAPNRSTTTVHHAAPFAGPAVGALTLQLRSELGSASCASKAARHLADVNGVLVVLNPPAAAPATLAVPGTSAVTPACVKVGPAFATLWSGNITHLSVRAVSGGPSSTTSAGAPVDVVIDVAVSPISSASSLSGAENRNETIDVVEQGIDVGTAVIGKGQVVILSVSRSIATFLTSRLRVH